METHDRITPRRHRHSGGRLRPMSRVAYSSHAADRLGIRGERVSAAQERYLFYKDSGIEEVRARLVHPYAWSIWRPSLIDLCPPGIVGIRTRLRFLLMCAMRLLG